MVRVIEGRRWLVAAAALGVGVPLVTGAGLVLTMAVSLLIAQLLPDWAVSILWITGCTAACVPLWILIRRCARAGGRRALVLGLAVAAVVPIASYALGAVTQAIRPGDNGMAGTLWIIASLPLGLYVVAALIMGFFAIRTGAAATRTEA